MIKQKVGALNSSFWRGTFENGNQKFNTKENTKTLRKTGRCLLKKTLKKVAKTLTMPEARYASSQL